MEEESGGSLVVAIGFDVDLLKARMRGGDAWLRLSMPARCSILPEVAMGFIPTKSPAESGVKQIITYQRWVSIRKRIRRAAECEPAGSLWEATDSPAFLRKHSSLAFANTRTSIVQRQRHL